MTFGEHLEELRRRVIHALIAFAIAFGVSFWFQDELMGFFTRPYEQARATVNAQIRETWIAQKRGAMQPLRLVDRVIDELAGAKALPDEALARLRAAQTIDRETPPELPTLDKLQAVHMAETFSAYMKLCLLAAALVSAPILLYQLWKFVGAGLYSTERTLVLRVMPFSLLLFFTGLGFGYFVLAELSVRFLVSYGDLEYVEPNAAIGAYLGLLFLLLLVMGLVFQIPLVMTVLAGVGLVKPETFGKKRRYFILGIFVLAAIITPPDYVSQLLVAGPMLFLFELGCVLAKVAARRRAERERDRDKKQGQERSG